MENSFVSGFWQDWKIPEPDKSRIEVLRAELGVPEWVARFLVNRGFLTPESCEKFLYPSLAKLPYPDVLPGIDKAVDRLRIALTAREPIAVYGDYDVDGITGAAILTEFLRSLGATATPVIPSRFEHGYGLNSSIINALASQGIKLLITVDCGITNIEEIRLASELGIDTIVTDHHQPGQSLPHALSVINPQLVDKDRDEAQGHLVRNLAGVGVVFYLLIALRKHLRTHDFWESNEEPNLKRYLDLVALGTIADQVPLSGVNRILTKYGLLELEKAKRPGVKALVELCDLANKKISVWDVGFLLAPRINAAGRMGRELRALELLLSQDTGIAQTIALELDSLNRQRQLEEEKILEEALSLVEKPGSRWKQASSLVLARDDWHRGIIGIVASRLVDKFGKPTILLGRNKQYLEGSARSVPNFNIFEALTACSSLLAGFGGHRMAAGLKIDPKGFPAFVRAFDRVAAGVVPPSGVRKRLTIDAKISLKEISAETMALVERLSPYGLGNPRPVFLLDSFNVKELKVLKEKHLSVVVEQNGKRMRAVGFNMVDASRNLPGSLRYLAFYPVYNHWEGNTYINLRILDFC